VDLDDVDLPRRAAQFLPWLMTGGGWQVSLKGPLLNGFDLAEAEAIR
jgi:hypothetical protein